ncbi:unnamed protein product [Rhizophagus irregularis]|nr:unnamed protein product [Rhizophagus irregularis]
MAKKKVIVAELSVIEFLESKFNSFNIKRYKFEELENVRNIESKNFGNVQIATLKENKVSVMLKLIPTDDIHESVNEIKLMWEAGTHKSILKFYGITKDQTKDDYFLVLEYVECNTFSDHLQDLYDYLDWNIKAGLALEIAKGLKFLHENNIAHKNLTAESILYPNNTIKLANFGILKNNVPQKRALKEKFTFWKKDKEQDHPKEYDILSFGIILFQLTQHVDYYINSNWETYLKSIPLEHREIKMDNIPIDYKKQYKELCKSCWSKNIKERPSIHQIVNSLQELGGNDRNDFVYNASQPGSETINDTSIKTTSTPSKPLTSSTTSTPSIPSTSSTQPTSYTAPHKPVTSSQLYTSPNIPTTTNIPTTNTTTTTYTNSRSSPYTSTTRTNTTNTPPTTTIPTNPLVPPTNPFLNNSGTANSAISPLTIDFILSPQQITSLILGLTTPPPQNTAPVTQEYVTKMYKTFHDKVAKCEMDISKLNDLYIIQYLNKTVQNENKVFDFCNANQSLMINKVLLGLFHQLAIGTTTVSLPKAYELYKEASKKNSFAAYIAGTYAQYGQGVPKNATEAYNFYKSSAESGFVPAYNKIGLCYDMGTGQYYLARCYEFGIGTTIDRLKALEWYQKSADNGNSLALLALADIRSTIQAQPLLYYLY